MQFQGTPIAWEPAYDKGKYEDTDVWRWGYVDAGPLFGKQLVRINAHTALPFVSDLRRFGLMEKQEPGAGYLRRRNLGSAAASSGSAAASSGSASALPPWREAEAQRRKKEEPEPDAPLEEGVHFVIDDFTEEAMAKKRRKAAEGPHPPPMPPPAYLYNKHD